MALYGRHRSNPKTVAKWMQRTSVSDIPAGPKDAHSTILGIEGDAVIVGFRNHAATTDDRLYALQMTSLRRQVRLRPPPHESEPGDDLGLLGRHDPSGSIQNPHRAD